MNIKGLWKTSGQRGLAYTVAMDWREYEGEIEAQFRQAYPSAQITHDAKLIGKFSKVERQIDLLIEEHAADFAVRIVVDAKYRGRKIDVSDVEAFIGLTRDVEAHTGMMVALEGYTPAAVKRAHNDDGDMILDVLNFEELKIFQGYEAFPYSGDRGVSIAAPFGWIVDATQRPGMVATLYERGLVFEDAARNNEFMYVAFWDKKNSEINSIDALLKYQEGYMLEGSPDAEILLLERARNRRVGAETRIRRFKKNAYPNPEYTGFVDFEDFIFMCVLFTPESLERKNLRKLRFVIGDAFPMKVKRDHTAKIHDAETRLKGESLPVTERAHLLVQIGGWHSEMDRLEDAMKAFEESLALVPNQYKGWKLLLATLIKLGNKEILLDAMSRLLLVDPHNPTVFDECIACTRSPLVDCSDLIGLFDGLRAGSPQDTLVQANCDFYTAKVLTGIDRLSAKEHLAAAQKSFRKVFPRGHQVFAAIRSALRELYKTN
jgi:tetratricopeptide (TPR) repeat protein